MDMNMQSIMAQAQKMQRDMKKKQEEIDTTEFVGKSEWVEVVFYGNKLLKSISIKKDQSLDSEEIEALEDMIQVAIKDAMIQIDKTIKEKLGSYADMAGGLF